jgi:hypothetical protein
MIRLCGSRMTRSTRRCSFRAEAHAARAHGVPAHGRALRVATARTRARGKGFVTDEVLIRERPADDDDRAIPDHWEDDLILGLDSSAIGTLVEPTTVSRCCCTYLAWRSTVRPGSTMAQRCCSQTRSSGASGFGRSGLKRRVASSSPATVCYERGRHLDAVGSDTTTVVTLLNRGFSIGPPTGRHTRAELTVFRLKLSSAAGPPRSPSSGVSDAPERR